MGILYYSKRNLHALLFPSGCSFVVPVQLPLQLRGKLEKKRKTEQPEK
jgi:hypothetical protein